MPPGITARKPRKRPRVRRHPRHTNKARAGNARPGEGEGSKAEQVQSRRDIRPASRGRRLVGSADKGRNNRDENEKKGGRREAKQVAAN